MNKITGPCAGLLMSAISHHAVADAEADRAFIRDQESFSQQLRQQDHGALRDMLSRQVEQNPLSSDDARFIGGLKQRQQEVHPDKPAHGALYFVSFAIPEAGLKRMLTEARRYDIPAVLRGMVNNDMKATADAVMSLVQDGSASGVAIDPNRYREYGITSVPSLMVYCPAGHDVIRGNLRLKQALGKVAEQGDCRDEARAMLEKGGQS